MEDERWLMMAVLDHLQKASTRTDVQQGPLQEAIFAISNAYSLNMHNAATRERYPLDGLSLPEVYKVGRETLLARKGSTVEKAESADTEVEDVGFSKFLKRLKETTSVFKGVEEGSEEHERRVKRARDKYDAKLRVKKTERGASSANREVSVEQKERAEKVKMEGNAALKEKKYSEAHELYTECIALDGSNAVYYSNRAAAKLHLELYMEAVEDCKRAIALDGAFLRPRERLAAAYRLLGMTDKEMETLEAAREVAPENGTIARQLEEAEQRVGRGSAGAGSAGGGAGLAGMLGGMNPGMMSSMARAMGLPDGAVESLLNSPMAGQMGEMMRNNPGLVQEAMSTMMGGGMPGTGSGGGTG